MITFRRLVRGAVARVARTRTSVEAAVARQGQRRLMRRLAGRGVRRINLCSGLQRVPGYFGIDVVEGCDLQLDLVRNDLPFREASLDAVVCMSAINYFARMRAAQLVAEIFRVLRPGGVCRVGVQDMRTLALRYVNNDMEFFFQKLPDGRDRFEGPTIGDKFVAWFYGYAVGKNRCEYFYDFEALAHLFRAAGFKTIERRDYKDSRLSDVALLDNRPDQMFYLEAVK